MYFKTDMHRRIYLERLRSNPYKCTREYLSALYILTADDQLWKASRNSVKHTEIRFSVIRVRKPTVTTYALFKVASDLYCGTSYISCKEICDKYLITDKHFELILTAMHIRRDGYEYLNLKPRGAV